MSSNSVSKTVYICFDPLFVPLFTFSYHSVCVSVRSLLAKASHERILSAHNFIHRELNDLFIPFSHIWWRVFCSAASHCVTFPNQPVAPPALFTGCFFTFTSLNWEWDHLQLSSCWQKLGYDDVVKLMTVQDGLCFISCEHEAPSSHSLRLLWRDLW